MQKIKVYTVDLSKIEGKGVFKCPKCKIKMSPDDQTEDTYAILKTVMKDDVLEKIILQCNKCGSLIHLVGFNLLNEIDQV